MKKEIQINKWNEEAYGDHDNNYKKEIATHVHLFDILCLGIANNFILNVYIFSSSST